MEPTKRTAIYARASESGEKGRKELDRQFRAVARRLPQGTDRKLIERYGDYGTDRIVNVRPSFLGMQRAALSLLILDIERGLIGSVHCLSAERLYSDMELLMDFVKSCEQHGVAVYTNGEQLHASTGAMDRPVEIPKPLAEMIEKARGGAAAHPVQSSPTDG